MASDPLPFNLHDQLEPLECNSRQTRRGSASPQSAHTSSLLLVLFANHLITRLWILSLHSIVIICAGLRFDKL